MRRCCQQGTARVEQLNCVRQRLGRVRVGMPYAAPQNPFDEPQMLLQPAQVSCCGAHTATCRRIVRPQLASCFLLGSRLSQRWQNCPCLSCALATSCSTSAAQQYVHQLTVSCWQCCLSTQHYKGLAVACLLLDAPGSEYAILLIMLGNRQWLQAGSKADGLPAHHMSHVSASRQAVHAAQRYCLCTDSAMLHACGCEFCSNHHTASMLHNPLSHTWKHWLYCPAVVQQPGA